jgi:hypothetical protein
MIFRQTDTYELNNVYLLRNQTKQSLAITYQNV